MSLLTEPLLELKEVAEAVKHIEKKKLPILITGCMESYR